MVAQSPRSLFNALIRRGIDLRALYRDAAAQAREPGLRAVLEENAEALDLLVTELQAQVRLLGSTPAIRGRLGGTARRQLVEWLLPAAPRRDDAWIEQLAHHEAALLQAFERAIAHAPAETALALRRLLPRLQSIHLDMHGLARPRQG
jgi:uncharacterized protein (TIGR02284 family)